MKCGLTKPLDEFYEHPMMADGRLNKCKACTRREVTENRNKNIEHYRQYDLDRAKNPDRKAACREITERWRRSDKRITAAHNAAARAFRSGLIAKKPCEKCGSQKSLMHHESYEKDRRLDVTWLCQPCHVWRHVQMAEEGINP